MPTLVKDARKRSPFWYACYTDSAGRRLKKSTRQTIKAKALEIARALERVEALARHRSLTEVRTREILSEVLERVTGEGLRVFTVRQWLQHFVKQKRKSRAFKTAARHEQMSDGFVRFLGRRADLNIAAITSKDISDFRDSREEQGLAPATVNLDITILSSAFKAAQKQGHISVNPCAAVEPLNKFIDEGGNKTLVALSDMEPEERALHLRLEAIVDDPTRIEEAIAITEAL